MEPGEDQGREAAMGDSMGSILDMAEKWSQYIRTRETEVRVAKSFIAGMLVFLLSSALAVAYLFVFGTPAVVTYPAGPAGPVEIVVRFHTFFLRGIEIGAVVGIACGLAMYFFLGRKENKELNELEGLVGRIKASNQDGSGSDALSLADKIFDLLPKLVRRRTSDALLFGIAAFILGTMVGTASVGIVIGVLVWIYFRYETNQSYERQLSRLDEQRKAFEREKRNFLESL